GQAHRNGERVTGRRGGARVAVSHVGYRSGPYLLSSPRTLRARVRAGPTIAATLGNEGSPVRLSRRVIGGLRVISLGGLGEVALAVADGAEGESDGDYGDQDPDYAVDEPDIAGCLDRRRAGQRAQWVGRPREHARDADDTAEHMAGHDRL